MKLSGHASIALKALYDAPNHSGDIVALFEKKGVSEPKERAWAAGQELNRCGLLEYYDESRAYADAKLNRAGIRYAEGTYRMGVFTSSCFRSDLL